MYHEDTWEELNTHRRVHRDYWSWPIREATLGFVADRDAVNELNTLESKTYLT